MGKEIVDSFEQNVIHGNSYTRTEYAVEATVEIASWAVGIGEAKKGIEALKMVKEANAAMKAAEAAEAAAKTGENLEKIPKVIPKVEKAEEGAKDGEKILKKTGEAGKGIETSYAKSSLNELKNVENFTDSSIEHIFEGNIKRGKAGGYHYESIEDTAGNVISDTEQSVNELGVYKAQVEVNGIPKTAYGGYSTFFPKNMSPQEVVDTINEAYINRSFVEGTRNTYRGESSIGIEIEMYIGKDGKIISAFPKE